jgi:RimJ/RimL family protein N-acetyltransferase
MNIIGEKVILRAIEMSDKEILLDIINDGETERLLGGWSLPVSDLNQQEWIKSLKPNNHILRCMAVDKVENNVIGTVILTDIDYKNGTAEIHIKLVKNSRGRGYGTDIIKTVVKYSFEELRLYCIFAYVNGYNEASQKLFERCGFEKEGTMRGRIYKNGNHYDVFSYSILNIRRG